MLEIAKQTWPEKAKLQEKQTLSPEQEQRLQKERQEILMLSQAQRNSLSSAVISSYLEKHHDIDISKYSPAIQKKFIEEVQMLFAEFKDFDTNMITSLRSIREAMSFWMEEWKKDDYYRNMIIWNALKSRITSIKLAIDTITGERIKIWNKEYNKSDYEELKTKTTKLDGTNWLNIFSKLENSPILTNYGKIAWVFSNELKDKIANPQPAWNLSYNEIIRTLPKAWTKWDFEKLTKVTLKNWQTINLVELSEEYIKTYKNFENKNEIFEKWNKQINKSEKWFWFSDSKVYWMDYDKIKDVYKDKFEELNLENMWVADLIIMLRVLFWVIPVIWDIDSANFDLKQFDAWVNFDGSMQNTWEKVLSAASPVLWVLSIIWFWYGVKVTLNSPKYAKAVMYIWKIIEKLSKSPEMLKDLAKNEKVMKMLEAMKWVVPKVGELLNKIKSQTKNVARWLWEKAWEMLEWHMQRTWLMPAFAPEWPRGKGLKKENESARSVYTTEYPTYILQWKTKLGTYQWEYKIVDWIVTPHGKWKQISWMEELEWIFEDGILIQWTKTLENWKVYNIEWKLINWKLQWVVTNPDGTKIKVVDGKKVWNPYWVKFAPNFNQEQIWPKKVDITRRIWKKHLNVANNEKIISNNTILRELWPKWLKTWMEQWPIWNCYFVSALNALKEHTNWAQILQSMIKSTWDWWWIVNFPWMKKQFPLANIEWIKIYSSDIEDMDRYKISWQLWDVIIERAYARYRERLGRDNWFFYLFWWYLERSWQTFIPNVRSWELSHEGGYWYEVFQAFFMDNQIKQVTFKKMNRFSDEKWLKEFISNLKWDELLTLSTPSARSVKDMLHIYFPNENPNQLDKKYKLLENSWDIWRFKIKDIYWVYQSFNFQHAYNIWEYDIKAWWLEVVNPHDTVNKRFKISIDDMVKFFYELTITEFKN